MIRKEGDIWNEGQSTWQLVNGIKVKITPLNNLREKFVTPLACPRCKSPLSHVHDKRLFRTQGMCLNCVTERDTQLMIEGKFKKHAETIVTANVNSIVQEAIAELTDFIDNTEVTKSHVDEFGEVETWEQGNLSSELKQELRKQKDSLTTLLTHE